jgi:hypothetical protein
MMMAATHRIHGIFSTSIKISKTMAPYSMPINYNIPPKFPIDYEITRVSCE